MAKITFIGAGSSVFAKNVLGDALKLQSLQDSHIALYDIDAQRLEDSQKIIEAINQTSNQGRAHITAHLGTDQRRDALSQADYVVNAIQVGGYDPCTITDFEVPKRFGLQQTIADTLGIGGIFRSLRTIPVMLDIAAEMEEVCPRAWLLNYTNPMCAITSAILRGSSVRTVGLCHSVQVCTRELLNTLGLAEQYPLAETRWEIAGINHQAWLLGVEHKGQDLYPVLKETARGFMDEFRSRGGRKWYLDVLKSIDADLESSCYDLLGAVWKAAHDGKVDLHDARLCSVGCDLVRLEYMFRFGYYISESSEHNAEYAPWFMKKSQPELINHYNIPIDEYKRRCVKQIAGWEKQREKLLNESELEHSLSHEFGGYIMDAMERDAPYRIAGNVMNNGLITNLPSKACVEVPCLVDRNGVQPTFVGDLPEQCAAMNRTNINPQIMTVEAALTGSKDAVYQAALLDPHTSAELSIDETIQLCDAMIDAHGDWLPKYK
jgi:alpha-galactosidase